MLRTVGFVWSLPLTVLAWLFIVLPLRAARLIRPIDARPLPWFVAVFKARGRLERYAVERGWNAFSLPCCVVLGPGGLDGQDDDRTLKHECRHIDQMLAFGVLQPLLYTACWLWLWGLRLAGQPVLPGWDNPFEADARKAAGDQRPRPV